MKMMDGLTVLRVIREDKHTAHVPVIMVSFDSGGEMMDKCREWGCYDYLTKPLEIDRLHESLERCFFERTGIGRKYLRSPLAQR